GSRAGTPGSAAPARASPAATRVDVGRVERREVVAPVRDVVVVRGTEDRGVVRVADEQQQANRLGHGDQPPAIGALGGAERLPVARAAPRAGRGAGGGQTPHRGAHRARAAAQLALWLRGHARASSWGYRADESWIRSQASKSLTSVQTRRAAI